MLVSAFTALLVLQSPVVELELRASTASPFVGQEVEVTLTIRVDEETAVKWWNLAKEDPSKLPELNIRWFRWETHHEGDDSPWGYVWFSPPDNWFCQHHTPIGKRGNSLPIRVRTWPGIVWCERVLQYGRGPFEEYRLRWRLLVTEYRQEFGGKIELRAVELKQGDLAVKSNLVQLDIAKLERFPPNAPDLDLGIGPYDVKAELDRSEVPLGESVRLTLKVGGAGNLTHLERPDLTKLEAFANTRRWTVESIGETWEGNGTIRCFRYRLTPKSEQIEQVPEIAVIFWEPGDASKKGDYRIVRLKPLPLKVLPKSDLPKVDTAPASPGELSASLQLLPAKESMLSRDSVWPSAAGVGTVLIGFPLSWLAAFAFKRWIAPRMLGETVWSPAAQQALAELGGLRDQPPLEQAERASGIMARYLRHRFGLRAGEPTPMEVETALTQAEVAEPIRQRTREFFEQCAAARFSIGANTHSDWTSQAERLLRELDGTP